MNGGRSVSNYQKRCAVPSLRNPQKTSTARSSVTGSACKRSKHYSLRVVGAPTAKNVETKFGFDPAKVGRHHLQWEIVSSLGKDERMAGARRGYLKVTTRDWNFGQGPLDEVATGRDNFLCFVAGLFDPDQCIYYFVPLNMKGYR